MTLNGLPSEWRGGKIPINSPIKTRMSPWLQRSVPPPRNAGRIARIGRTAKNCDRLTVERLDGILCGAALPVLDHQRDQSSCFPITGDKPSRSIEASECP